MVSTDYEEQIIVPAFELWDDLLNVSGETAGADLHSLRISGRQRLVEAAEQFVLRLDGIAEDADLPTNRSMMLTGDPEQKRIVMTGHQPTVFHSGLTFKYETTETFAEQQKAIGVAVVIDSDQGDAGRCLLPAVQTSTAGGQLSRLLCSSTSMAQSSQILAHAGLQSASRIEAISRQFQSALSALDRSGQIQSVRTILQQYAGLSAAGASAAEANLIMRWQHGIGGRLLELPLTAIAGFPEVMTLTANVIRQTRRFAVAYNNLLQVFRQENRVRNPANPFPDLEITDSRCELPFWVVNHEARVRYPLHVETRDDETRLMANGEVIDSFAGDITGESLEPLSLQNIQLIPRGALITAFLRLLFSDLFVHGTGGAKYDRFTDELVRAWWNVDLTPFCVASASRYFFKEERTEWQRLQTLKTQLRDLQFNPQRHFGTGAFSQQLETRLQQLFREKQEHVDQLKSAQAAEVSGRDIGREIQSLTNQIKSEVAAEFQPQLDLLASVSSGNAEAIDSRLYPWFLFAT